MFAGLNGSLDLQPSQHSSSYGSAIVNRYNGSAPSTPTSPRSSGSSATTTRLPPYAATYGDYSAAAVAAAAAAAAVGWANVPSSPSSFESSGKDEKFTLKVLSSWLNIAVPLSSPGWNGTRTGSGSAGRLHQQQFNANPASMMLNSYSSLPGK